MLPTRWVQVTVAVALFTWGATWAGFLSAADALSSPGGDGISWSYHSNAGPTRPIARSIGLSDGPPQDLTEEVTYRGSLRRYGQLRYGSENSRRVVIVVDELADGQYDLFVDADRDRKITDEDRVEGSGRTRTCPLKTEIIGDTLTQDRVELGKAITRDVFHYWVIGEYDL